MRFWRSAAQAAVCVGLVALTGCDDDSGSDGADMGAGMGTDGVAYYSGAASAALGVAGNQATCATCHSNDGTDVGLSGVSLMDIAYRESFKGGGFRAVPTAVVRHGAYIGRDVVLMPSFVNIGAYVGSGTMIDTWSTVGSCAQVGANCHISGGVGLGGVLEPLQAQPVIVEDNCFIGARSEVAEGVVVGEGSVLAMGVFLSASTKIVDRSSGEVFTGKVPPQSVVVPGSMPGGSLADGTPGPSLSCAVIVKTVDQQTRSKTSINELLRHG